MHECLHGAILMRRDQAGSPMFVNRWAFFVAKGEPKSAPQFLHGQTQEGVSRSPGKSSISLQKDKHMAYFVAFLTIGLMACYMIVIARAVHKA